MLNLGGGAPPVKKKVLGPLNMATLEDQGFLDKFHQRIPRRDWFPPQVVAGWGESFHDLSDGQNLVLERAYHTWWYHTDTAIVPSQWSLTFSFFWGGVGFSRSINSISKKNTTFWSVSQNYGTQTFPFLVSGTWNEILEKPPLGLRHRCLEDHPKTCFSGDRITAIYKPFSWPFWRGTTRSLGVTKWDDPPSSEFQKSSIHSGFSKWLGDGLLVDHKLRFRHP